MAKEFDRIGLPVAHITTVVPLAQQIGSNRIVKGVKIPHPCGDPNLPPDQDRRLRRRILDTAFRALQTEVTRPTVFNPDEG
ncbi:MAG: glycine/betaine/sarcosine/D-proline family reductase selenoprotein B [Chloroflexi bacterium]|nr:glycine/betaine/sarcosine/D-proline family reductase selenoprotein B [Chloroflexota bacterium]